MSKYDERRKQLGIATAEPVSTSGSKYDRRRAELAAVKETTRQQSIQQTTQRQEQSTLDSEISNDIRMYPLRFVQGIEQRAQQRETEEEAANQAAARAAEEKHKLDVQARREKGYASEPPIIRDIHKGLDKLGDFVRPATDFAESTGLVPGTGIPGGNLISQGTSFGLSKLAPVLGRTAAGRIGTTAASLGAEGSITGAGATLAATGDGREALKGAAFGGAGGAVLGGLGRGIGELVSKNTRDIQQQLGGVVGAIDAAMKKEYPAKLTSPGALKQLDEAMTKIKPIVTDRMTPPLENPNELAKWIQTHAGIDNLSLNEIRRLPYEDMRQLAEEIRPTLSTATEAYKAAKELGYDLPALLEGQGRTIAQRTTQDASRRAYGVYPKELPDVRRNITSKYDARRKELGISQAAERAAGGSADIAEPSTVATARDAQGAVEGVQPIKMNWFTRLFGDQGVGISPFGSTKSKNIVTTEQQIVKNPLRNNVRGVVNSAKQGARSGYQNTVDMLSPLKSINRATYDTALDASRANNVANTIIRDKFVDLEGNVLGNSLDDIMKETRGLGKKFDDYLILRHAETRMRRGERVYDDALNMTPEKAKTAYEALEKQYPGLRELGEQWDAFNANLLDSGVREGLISQTARDSMREANPHYASMRRQFTVGEKMAQPKWGNGGSSFSGQKAPIKEVSPTGSTRRIVTPIRSAIEQTYAWKNAELRNRTMQEIAHVIQLDPDGMKGIAEIVKKPSTSYKSLDDALREGGSEEFLELLDNDFKSLFKKSQSGEENIVRAMINGNPVFIKVHNPEAVKALLGLGNEQAGIILRAMQTLSNATKRGATGLLAPMFAVKSLTADTVQAAIQSPNAFKHIAVDLPHALISSIGDVLRIPGLKNLAEDFRRSGGEYSALLRGERQLNTTVSSLRRNPLLSGKGLAQGALATVRAPFRALEKVADMSENANRMAAFRRAMKGKERTPENVRKAINAARESTVNFSRKGAFARETEAFVPYSNAAIQGMYRITKAFVKNPVKTLAGLGALVVLPKLYEYARFNNDPDYQKLPARERYRNIIISKNPDGSFNKQFMPPEYLAFGAFLTDVLNDVINNDPQAYKGTMDALANSFTPPIVTGAAQGITQGGGFEQSLKGALNATVAAPAVAIAGNQSFTGAPIVPKRLEGNSVEFQYDERTSSIAKEIGKRIGMAPLKVDYLIRAYGGDPARLLLPLTSDAGMGTPRNTLLRNFIVDPVFTNTLSNDFYAAKDAFTKARNDFEDFGKPLPKWYSDSSYNLLNSQAKSSASKRLSSLNTEKRNVQGDRTLSAKAKADRLRNIQSEINDIYVDVNSKIQSAGFEFPNR